ncbi:MAG: acetyl-CoA carboxylase carboxyltransferase subunit alpha [Halobacteriovoraceae bacterium]|nr:acetyl-CoA carboxylase carboxyltransferase subunit alpha [Halobacteriovoraceae bacterium]MCB9095434.1 acetyl-CoA carboxylase carboxyltransferase subunit alpha [Halobacteriovoraceae bacterium]
MDYVLDFEKPVSELENQIKELKTSSSSPQLDLSKEIAALQSKVNTLIKEIYQNLSPWERVQLARHPSRPHALDYINGIIDDFHEVAGDRFYSDDMAIVTGFGMLDQQKVAIIGIEKGRKTQDKIKRNFGMPNPEGYRKALRLAQLASRFHIPIITFVDTPGAYPGIGAEERGQAHAIAENLEKFFSIEAPIISVIIGEGGSGGALGIAIADRVLMQEYSVYSVISPESCASILWSDPKMAEKAANSLQLTPQKAIEFEVIDHIISEPAGGAHRNPEEAVQLVKKSIQDQLKNIVNEDVEGLLEKRFERFRKMGNKYIK